MYIYIKEYVHIYIWICISVYLYIPIWYHISKNIKHLWLWCVWPAKASTVTRSLCWHRPSPMWTPVPQWVAAPGACEVRCQSRCRCHHVTCRVSFPKTGLSKLSNKCPEGIPKSIQNSSKIHLKSPSFHPMAPRVLQNNTGWCRAERTAAVLSRNEKLLVAARMKHGRCMCPKKTIHIHSHIYSGTDGVYMIAELCVIGTSWIPFRKPVDLGHCMWRIAAIMCDEYSVSPNSMERWKPYSSTLFTHFVLG